MKKIITGICIATLLSSGLAFAASHADPIATRKAEMKKVGGAMKTLATMAKGGMAFDGAAALAAMETMQGVAGSFKMHFPAGSESGGETTASPKIWSDAAGFEAANTKFSTDIASAIASAPADVAGLGAALGQIGPNCSACHQAYRVK
ncbi:MAG: cytochrome c [Nitratireductor sp.]